MIMVREILAHLLAAIFVAAGLLMMGIAWIGIDKALSWQIALGLLVFSAAIRTNLFVLVGSFLFAEQVWGLPMLDALVFTMPGLLLLFPGEVKDLLSAILRPNVTV